MKQLKKGTKRTLSASAFLAAFLLAVLLLNLIVGAAADKIQLSWDMTENKLYALTDETKNVLADLKEDVTLYYFVSPGQGDSKVVQTLDMYRTASPKLKIIQNDPNTDPIASRRFTDKGISVQQNTIVLERGARFKAILPSDIYQSYTTQSGSTMNAAFFGLEQLITRGISYVSSDTTKRVAFTVGHNEIDYSPIMETLENENMEVFQVDLKTDTLPDDIDSVYIMAPQEDFTEEEVLRLDAFLSKGRGAHVAFDARRKALPRLEKYLQEFWGVTMYHDLVCEGDSSRTLNYAYMFLPTLSPHAVTKDIVSGNQSTVYMYTRSLSLGEAEGVTEAVPLAVTSEHAFSVHGSDRNVKENIREGSLPISAALTKKSMDGSIESRMVVSGSYQIYDPFFLEEGSLANRALLYGTANFVNKDDTASLSISPKSLLMRTVMISDGLTRFYIILICILPAVVCFVLCFITFRRRRHL